jgi:hypothetical protein
MSNVLLKELNNLRSHRVALRKTRERLAFQAGLEPQKRYGVDGSYNQIERTELALRLTEKRWLELHALLGLRPPGPAIKLAIRR